MIHSEISVIFARNKKLIWASIFVVLSYFSSETITLWTYFNIVDLCGMLPYSLVCPAFDHLITTFAHARYGYSLYFFI